MRSSKSIAIVGGGLLGSELAYSIKRRLQHINGLQITQIFKEDDVLEEILPVKLCEDASKQLFKHGIKLLNNSSLMDASRTKDGAVRLILRKEDGSKHEVVVDHVIVALDAEPNVQIARKTGLEIDKVFLEDVFMILSQSF
jgi:pyruvate/2-oxoglutarate dehydrogenase complex dihydrolipoamide dehydrogenase (E3) component